MTKQRLTTMITLRTTPALKKQFHKKAEKIGDTGEVHREIISAFVEDRMTITPPKNPLYKETDK